MSEIRLVSVYKVTQAPGLLYEFLRERLQHPETNISHQKLPPMKKHLAFFNSRPYRGWYLLQRKDTRTCVGACYLTRQSEVGIYVAPGERGKGYASQALDALRDLYQGPMLANVNPANEASRAFFERQGGRLLQVTYELPRRSR